MCNIDQAHLINIKLWLLTSLGTVGDALDTWGRGWEGFILSVYVSIPILPLGKA